MTNDNTDNTQAHELKTVKGTSLLPLCNIIDVNHLTKRLWLEPFGNHQSGRACELIHSIKKSIALSFWKESVE